jgi:hypothetical protein
VLDAGEPEGDHLPDGEAMNLLDLIKRKFSSKTVVDPDAAFYPNRHERRARGIKTPVGLVPEGLEGFKQETMMPRYFIRHYKAAIAGRSTRRRRKIRARINAAMRKQGQELVW